MSAGAALLALGGTALLVPRLGAVGAPIATSLAMLASCLHAWILGQRHQPMPIPLRVVAQVACAAGVMAVAVLAVPAGFSWSLYVKVALGIASYAVACVAVDLLGLRGKARQKLAGSVMRFRRLVIG